MNHEQHFEGDDSARTWRSPKNDIYIPRTPTHQEPRIVIRISIKSPVTKKPEKPPITFEGLGDFDAGVDVWTWQDERRYRETHPFKAEDYEDDEKEKD